MRATLGCDQMGYQCFISHALLGAILVKEADVYQKLYRSEMRKNSSRKDGLL